LTVNAFDASCLSTAFTSPIRRKQSRIIDSLSGDDGFAGLAVIVAQFSRRCCGECSGAA
jgi:hypothetical protein